MKSTQRKESVSLLLQVLQAKRERREKKEKQKNLLHITVLLFQVERLQSHNNQLHAHALTLSAILLILLAYLSHLPDT